jgi:hypothetical protein
MYMLNIKKCIHLLCLFPLSIYSSEAVQLLAKELSGEYLLHDMVYSVNSDDKVKNIILLFKGTNN